MKRPPPVPPFEPRLHLSPYALFDRLAQGRPPVLVDLRPAGSALTLAGAARDVPAAGDVVLFDDDGRLASDRARRLHAAGRRRVRALYGGLELYDFALPARVVGEERFLRRPQLPRAAPWR